MKLELVILPEWLLNSLKSNNLSLANALDISSLTRILSVDDVSFYLAINRYLFEEINKPLRDTFIRVDFSQLDKYTMSLPDGTRPNRESVKEKFNVIENKTLNMYSLPSYKPTLDNLLDILPYNENGGESIKSVEGELVFELVEVRENVFGIKFKRRNNKAPMLLQTIQCYDDVLSQLDGLYGFEYISTLPLFNAFCRMSRHTSISR